MASKPLKKTVKREPTPGAVLKKIGDVVESNKSLQKEIKSISKIFADNQKILVSMKQMIDTLVSALEDIQKQSKQISILEGDTQKLYAGLNQVRAQSNLITKIDNQTARLQKEISGIKLQKTSKDKELYKQVEDGMNGIRNNSKMIIKIAQRIDEVRDDLRAVSGKTDSFANLGTEIGKLKNDIDSISEKTDGIKIDAQTMQALKHELKAISEKVTLASGAVTELDAIKTAIDSISGRASKIESLEGVLEGLKQQFETVSAKTNAASSNLESLRNMAGKIDRIETEISSLTQRTDSTAFVGEGLKSVQEDLSNFKQNVFDRTEHIEQKISTVSDLLRRQDEAAMEFHKKSDMAFSELQSVRNVVDKTSRNSSQEMMALLKLSEYQSTIRMLAESKYGTLKDLESMASQTVQIVNLFDKISIESGERIPLPSEVSQWAVSKILDCADRWDVRFGDAYSVLISSLGKDMVKEAVRIQQVRDIYGIRGVDEIRDELGMS